MSSRRPAPIIVHSPLLGQPQPKPSSALVACATRLSIRPQAILDVVRRRGRSLGLLAQYEESRLKGSGGA